MTKNFYPRLFEDISSEEKSKIARKETADTYKNLKDTPADLLKLRKSEKYIKNKNILVSTFKEFITELINNKFENKSYAVYLTGTEIPMLFRVGLSNEKIDKCVCTSLNPIIVNIGETFLKRLYTDLRVNGIPKDEDYNINAFMPCIDYISLNTDI